MYQAWLVQDFDGTPYNILLGEDFKTAEEAYDAIALYEEVFGKCNSGRIEPAGTPIPTAEPKKETLLDLVRKWFS